MSRLSGSILWPKRRRVDRGSVWATVRTWSDGAGRLGSLPSIIGGCVGYGDRLQRARMDLNTAVGRVREAHMQFAGSRAKGAMDLNIAVWPEDAFVSDSASVTVFWSSKK